MNRSLLFALVVLGAKLPSARAADLAPLYPDGATFALGINVKGITSSPLGKTVIGKDKPFDATRKLLKTLFPEDILPLTDKALAPLESVTNRLERVTVVGDVGGGRGRPPIAIYLEGAIEEAEYFKAAESLAKDQNEPFTTEKHGDRKLFVAGKEGQQLFGLRVSPSLFLVATTRELVEEVLDKHAGKKRATVQKALAASLAKVKPAETPIWFVIGEIQVLRGITGGVATIALKEDADFRMEVICDEDKMAGFVARILEQGVDYLTRAMTPQGKLWNAAGIAVKRDGMTITASGSIPGKLLAEEYGKRK
jgi:hypothetical protein